MNLQKLTQKNQIFGIIFSKVVYKLTPINKELIKKEKLFKKMDEWHKNNKDKDFNKKEYTQIF